MTSERLEVRRRRGLLIVISGPSGVGKGTIISSLIEHDPNLKFSVSVTTRAPRFGEVHGVHYFFVTPEEFQRMRESGELLEWAEVHGHLYGTPRKFVEDITSSGYDVVLDIDVQGGIQVMRSWEDAVSIFILPPSMEELERRLRGRGTDSPEEIERRLKDALHELTYLHHYKYAVVNDRLSEAVKQVEAIIISERLRVKRLEVKLGDRELC